MRGIATVWDKKHREVNGRRGVFVCACATTEVMLESVMSEVGAAIRDVSPSVGRAGLSGLISVFIKRI